MNSRIGSVFISHSTENPDYQTTEVLAEELTKIGLNVWWDKERLIGGDIFPVEILEAIIRQTYFLFIISERSINSKWCLRELIRADELEKVIIPLLLEDISKENIPIQLAGVHYIDIRQGIHTSLPMILRSLGIGLRPPDSAIKDPFAKDGHLVNTIARQLNYAKTFTSTLNLIRMLQLIGEECSETVRAKELFKGMTSQEHYTGGSIDYNKVREYLLEGWMGR